MGSPLSIFHIIIDTSYPNINLPSSVNTTDLPIFLLSGIWILLTVLFKSISYTTIESNVPDIAKRFLLGDSNKAIEVTLVVESAKRYMVYTCLLYTSDAADDLLCVDLGGRRIIKKKKKKKQKKIKK